MKTDPTPEEAAALDAHIFSTNEVGTVQITNSGVKLKFAVEHPTPELWMYVANALKMIADDLTEHYHERMILLNSKPQGNA